MQTKRSFGVDILKILAMLMICGYHVLEHGGVLAALTPGSVSYAAAWLIAGSSTCGVNMFAMASGYLGAGRRVRLSSAVMHWLQVAFYTVLITLAAAVLWPGLVGKQELLNALLPVTFQQYWYVTAYFCMLAFSPVMNHALAHLPRRELAGCMAGILLLLSVQQTALQYDIYGANHGYSTLWLMAMYLAGGLWKRFETDAPAWTVPAGFAAAGVCFALILAFRVRVNALAAAGIPQESSPALLMRFTSPLMVLAAFSLLAACSRLTCRNASAVRVIMGLSQATFGVYLIHDHPFIRARVIGQNFSWLAGLPWPALLLLAIACAAGVFLVCAAAETLRAGLFRLLRVKTAVVWAEERALRFLTRHE